MSPSQVKRAVRREAWVPMIPENRARGAEADLWRVGRTGNVIRAMSLVPDEVRTVVDLSDAHYLPEGTFMVFTGKPYGTLTRLQIEVIAGRVSALNGGFS